MTEPDRRQDLTRLLTAAARAHHEATGGPNPGWAEWYAEYLHTRVGSLLGSTPSVAELTEWLTRADERYRLEEPEGSWPRYYATWFLEWDEASE